MTLAAETWPEMDKTYPASPLHGSEEADSARAPARSAFIYLDERWLRHPARKRRLLTAIGLFPLLLLLFHVLAILPDA